MSMRKGDGWAVLGILAGVAVGGVATAGFLRADAAIDRSLDCLVELRAAPALVYSVTSREGVVEVRKSAPSAPHVECRPFSVRVVRPMVKELELREAEEALERAEARLTETSELLEEKLRSEAARARIRIERVRPAPDDASRGASSGGGG